MEWKRNEVTQIFWKITQEGKQSIFKFRISWNQWKYFKYSIWYVLKVFLNFKWKNHIIKIDIIDGKVT